MLGDVIHPTLYGECDYLSMLELKLNHIDKKGHTGQCFSNHVPDQCTFGFVPRQGFNCIGYGDYC